MAHETVDLGCGPRKAPGAFGVDHYPYDGVDLVADLDEVPWPIEDNRFSTIIASHIIEHVADPVAFMCEIHRIGQRGTEVHITTPHFSSVSSYKDPTHRRHLSARWYMLFTEEGYLASHTGRFEAVSTSVSCRTSVWAWIARAQIRLLGLDRWEKNLAFCWPAQDITTVLRIIA